MRVKVCGITRLSDAEAAVEAGADALGFVLWDGSPRRVRAADVGKMSLDLPPYVARVGVFVNEDRTDLRAMMLEGGLTEAQLHGEEEPGYCQGLDVSWYRVFRVGSEADAGELVAEIGRFARRVFMLDTRADTSPRGTGRPFDWRLAARISVRAALAGHGRLILAGGLNPANVAEAIRMARPWAVDVSSGVEAAPGIKDPALIGRFIQAVRSAQ